MKEQIRSKKSKKKEQGKDLEITMDHVGRVNILQPSKNLVNKVLNMINCKRLARVDDSMQISFHKVLLKRGERE